MKAKLKTESGQPSLMVDSEVVRNIRQHARSSMATEICGVLIGQDKDLRIEVMASIEGENAEQAGAHVTFTQDTWEHIYAVKDKKFPNQRIVGWYHSHPGFGIFLSEHDTFIHKNFFSSPGQVAWVFDPQSDEEGCFGWVNGRIERLTRIAVRDQRGGEVAESTAKPSASNAHDDEIPGTWTERTAEPENGRVRVTSLEAERRESDGSMSLEQLVAKVFFALSLLVLGGVLSWYFLPHLVPVPVMIDPTGKLIDLQTGEVLGQLPLKNGAPESAVPANTAKAPARDAGGTKGNDAKSK